jgi:hypothetical protein
MLNIFSILGPSRCGKGAIIPIISAIKNFELPFNTPDLDWYVDAYNSGDLTSDALCKLSVNYLLCYSWYGYLGRHINLRPNDYYSMQKMMPHINLLDRHNREDKDCEFNDFLTLNDNKEFWNIFQWDIPPKIYEMIGNSYPVNTNPLYCYRSPYYLFTSWVSGNRVSRANSLSRMLKYDSMKNLERNSLHSQFIETRNQNEVSFNKSEGKYTYHDFKFENLRITPEEESELLKLCKDNLEASRYWSKKEMLFRFEHIATDPYRFVDYLKGRFDIEFDEDLLKKGIKLMDERTMDKVVELDMSSIEDTLKSLNCSDKAKDFIINEQLKYIDEL